MKKYDKLLDLMEKINEKVRQESYISKLGIPSLIVSLLAFQAEVKELRLDLHMDEEIRMQSLRHPEAAEALIRSLLDDFRKEAVSFPDDNRLQLHLSKYPGGIGLAARYEGGYDPKRVRFAESAIRSMGIDRYGWTVEARYGEGQVEWTVRLPASHDS
ncbi:hypothetical protein O9H85_13165 [Paenibacillus filicis]|uniref:Sensor histidine kinase n=1 Tax=Paenibacillus gyeongsangnamensis TaxID=3388067 RepID=A0ABT4Q910_9BACL|nr:hypothetical protein [Paenibacillus filicis]MCZ8513360.1 hypothetical protein [Paenibacillus filicis]